MIERHRKNDIADDDFDEWLSGSSYSLKKLGIIDRYYTICKRQDLNSSDIMVEIQKYEHLDCDALSLLLSGSWSKGDDLFGQNKIKADIFAAYQKSKSNGESYDVLYRHVIPHYSENKAFCDMLFFLADHYDEANPSSNRCAFAIELYGFCSDEKQRDSVWNTTLDITDMMWDDLVENGSASALYNIWLNGYSVHVSSDRCTKAFSKQFALCIKSKSGSLADNIMPYFITIDGVYKSEYTGQDIVQHCLEFDYDKAKADMAVGNVCNLVFEKIQEMHPDIVFSYPGNTYYDKDLIAKMGDVCGDRDFSVTSPHFTLKMHLSQVGVLNFEIKKSEKTVRKFDSSGNPVIFGDGRSETLSFFMNRDNQIYYKCDLWRNKKTMWYPLSIKKLAPYLICEPIVRVFDTIAVVTNNPFLKDVIHDAAVCGENFISPIKYADTITYHSRTEYFMSAYKCAGMLKWNYNRHNINLSYMVLKATSKVSLNDYGILQNTSDDMLEYVSVSTGKGKLNSSIIKFLAGYYAKKDPHCISTAHDYIRMCIDSKKDVVLHYSVKRMRDEHDHFMDSSTYADYKRKTKPFRVPKDSRFNTIRKALPESFEWIKSRKRLIHESMMMHHCVWSYYKKIGDDRCAIYSYYDETGQFDVSGDDIAKRYTIEFVWDSRKSMYAISQIQTKHDRGGGAKLKEYIKGLLDDKGVACL